MFNKKKRNAILNEDAAMMRQIEKDKNAREVAYVAGGCFWGVEHAYKKLPGVVEVASGYQQGNLDYPTYK